MEEAIQIVISQCEMWVDYEYGADEQATAKRVMSYYTGMNRNIYETSGGK
jgi:hypothetical protein